MKRIVAPLGMAALLVVAAGPASAHAPVAGMGGFYAGLLHPFLVPSHFLLLVGTSLFIAQDRPDKARTAILVFVVAYGLGVAAAVWSVPLPGGETTLLAFAAAAGLLTAIDGAALRAASVPVAIAAGVVLGLDSGPDDGPLQARLLMAMGACLGGAVGAIALCGLAVEPAAPWKRIARRIAGSWMTAAAVLVLALALPRY